jgi:hypothetical protein
VISGMYVRRCPRGERTLKPTTLLAESRSGGRGGLLPWVLLVIGSVASLTANVAVAEPTVIGRVIAAWPSFALIGSYELLMRQVRRAAGSAGEGRVATSARPERREPAVIVKPAALPKPSVTADSGLDVRRQAWQWAQAHLGSDGSLPSGRAIGNQYGRHERWGQAGQGDWHRRRVRMMPHSFSRLDGRGPA